MSDFSISVERTTSEFEVMRLSLSFFDVPEKLACDIMEAYTSPEWDWRTSDGCTVVSELHYRKGMRFPPCVRHDYDCWLYEQGRQPQRVGHNRFFATMRAYRVPLWRSAVRWLGVTLLYPAMIVLRGGTASRYKS